MGKQYRKPPVVEALCEFRLSQDTPWDLTTPGLLYERMKDTFPEREPRVIQEFEVTHEPQGVQHRIRTSERILLFSNDRKTFIQLGPRLLLINVLKPYPTWHRFKPYIQQAWTILTEVTDVRRLERIGLRYVNRIEIPVSQIDLKTYFELYPFIGERLPQKMDSFLLIAEFPYHDGRDRCRVQLAPALGGEAQAAVILDIDYFLARPGAIAISEAIDWVEEAHTAVEAIFEGCITDSLRNFFEEVP